MVFGMYSTFFLTVCKFFTPHIISILFIRVIYIIKIMRIIWFFKTISYIPLKTISGFKNCVYIIIDKLYHIWICMITLLKS